jgi:hypothetical protein
VGGGTADEGGHHKGRGRSPPDLVRAGRAPRTVPPAAPLPLWSPHHRRHRPLWRRRPQLALAAANREDVLRLRHPVLAFPGAAHAQREPATATGQPLITGEKWEGDGEKWEGDDYAIDSLV